MTSKLFIAGILLLTAGTIGRVYASSYSHVDAEGILRDTAWLPIGSLMMLAGLFFLLISAALYGTAYLRSG